MRNAPVIYIVVPCYNEEEVLPLTAEFLGKKLDDLTRSRRIHPGSRVLMVDDGSKDRTWKLIEELHEKDERFAGVKLSRNRGHQNALLAGLFEAARRRCDAAISMDADLQDDVDACDAMIERYMAGCDIVYGVRRHRATDTFFKRTTALGFYKIMNLTGHNAVGTALVDRNVNRVISISLVSQYTVYNHADYRLMSRRALEGLAEFSEVNLFLRGIVPMIGYPSDVVYYDRKERAAGESKYPLKKMLAFAIEGITSLSTKPIRMITFMGIAAFFVSIGFLIWAVVDFFRGNTITGWASMMVSLWFIGGLLLLSVGIVGEYVGKIYLESKHRPRYIIESRTPDRIREREKGRSRKQEMPGENLRRSRAEARELQTSKRREAVQKPEQE